MKQEVAANKNSTNFVSIQVKGDDSSHHCNLVSQVILFMFKPFKLLNFPKTSKNNNLKNNLTVSENSFKKSNNNICFTVDETKIDKLIEKFQNININMSIHGSETGKNPEQNINKLYNSLRIPDAVKDLPKYDGNRHTLFEFIENVTEILEICDEISGAPCTRILLRAIRNKIVGEANEVLNMYGTPLNWDSIRENLISHYADKRSEINLIRDLHSINQQNNTIEEYYSKIIDLQSTMINFTKINENNLIVIDTKNNLFKEMCLSTFLAGLREPLGSMVRAMQPDDIQEAFQYCLKEQNIQYAKKSSNQTIYTRKPLQPPLPIRNFQPLLPQRPFHPQQPYQPRFQNFNKPQYYNHKPFNNNPFRNPNPNPNFNRNNFSQPFNKPPIQHNQFQQDTRKFEPMDTTSNKNKFTQPTRFQQQPQYHQNRNFFQATGPPRFQSQEIHNIEKQESEIVNNQEQPKENYHPNLDDYNENDVEYDYSLDPEAEIEEEDFRQEALDQLDLYN